MEDTDGTEDSEGEDGTGEAGGPDGAGDTDAAPLSRGEVAFAPPPLTVSAGELQPACVEASSRRKSPNAAEGEGQPGEEPEGLVVPAGAAVAILSPNRSRAAMMAAGS